MDSTLGIFLCLNVFNKNISPSLQWCAMRCIGVQRTAITGRRELYFLLKGIGCWWRKSFTTFFAKIWNFLGFSKREPKLIPTYFIYVCYTILLMLFILFISFSSFRCSKIDKFSNPTKSAKTLQYLLLCITLFTRDIR